MQEDSFLAHLESVFLKGQLPSIPILFTNHLELSNHFILAPYLPSYYLIPLEKKVLKTAALSYQAPLQLNYFEKEKYFECEYSYMNFDRLPQCSKNYRLRCYDLRKGGYRENCHVSFMDQHRGLQTTPMSQMQPQAYFW